MSVQRQSDRIRALRVFSIDNTALHDLKSEMLSRQHGVRPPSELHPLVLAIGKSLGPRRVPEWVV